MKQGPVFAAVDRVTPERASHSPIYRLVILPFLFSLQQDERDQMLKLNIQINQVSIINDDDEVDNDDITANIIVVVVLLLLLDLLIFRFYLIDSFDPFSGYKSTIKHVNLSSYTFDINLE